MIWLLTKVEKDVAPYLREAIVDREYDSNAMVSTVDIDTDNHRLLSPALIFSNVNCHLQCFSQRIQ